MESDFIIQFSIFKKIADLGFSRLAIFFFFCLILGCGNSYTPEEEKNLKTLSCKTSEKIFSYDEVAYYGQKGGNQLQYSNIREGIYSACMNCHLAPSNAGGFSFIDSYKGQIKTIAGETKFFPGYFEIAEKVYEYLNILEGEVNQNVIEEIAEYADQKLFITKQLKVCLKVV